MCQRKEGKWNSSHRWTQGYEWTRQLVIMIESGKSNMVAVVCLEQATNGQPTMGQGL